MGNLGSYQKMTTVVKALGGPKKAATIVGTGVAVGGYAVLRLTEAGIKKGVRASRAAVDRGALISAVGQTFRVTTAGQEPSGLVLSVGDEFRILEGDADAILIEVLGREDNPHFVSSAFLTDISDFPNGSSPR
ncbi:hypothetical protein CFH99_24440 [Nocardioides aromaticivorans]|uniref:Uncharacterized protein n=1 Tax=Nocardioides aromaticivorans TaxID=200618 RepID=A0ABX7PRY6_9ACTN|nr:hypothetical protein [Nocardioides aromaticivorans]QSR28775.1 hypothetical protein CFH99_24440 [Nocardioides aromaticivorans]